jgi:hypothetical protein
MPDINMLTAAISPELLDAVKALPSQRTVRHCGTTFVVNPFDIYVMCPTCGQQIKVRAFSGSVEIEDVFDAVFTWMSHPETAEAARQRIAAICNDMDE